MRGLSWEWLRERTLARAIEYSNSVEAVVDSHTGYASFFFLQALSKISQSRTFSLAELLRDMLRN